MAAVSSAEREMNLSALQQRDPYITSIADSASQVAVYSFNSTIHEWEKTNVEGTLFVYSRSANPVNGFMIINRLHLNDLIEPINKNLEFQLQDPFLLYRNEKAAIYGIWFYDRDECARIGQLMNSLVQIAAETQQKESTSGRQRRASESDTTIDARSSDAGKGIDVVQKNVDILQMLSKAQDEYDKSKAQILRKSSTPTVTTNGNCVSAIDASGSSPITRQVKCNAGSKSTGLESGSAGTMKTVKVLRPTAVKPVPLQIDSSKGAGCQDPSITPNTQISLEALFKRAVLQQDGNLQPNSYRVQHSGVQMVPSVAQLMSTQTGTTTVEELERQQHSNARRSEIPKTSGVETGAAAATANGPIFSHSVSVSNELESPNTMLRHTLNLGPSTAEAHPPKQTAIPQNCPEAPLMWNFIVDAAKGNEVAERKICDDEGAMSQIGAMSQVCMPLSQLSLQNHPSSHAGVSSPSAPLASSLLGPIGSGSARLGSNNFKPVLQAPGVMSSGGSAAWSSSPLNDILAPPETFQVASLKYDGANVLLSPMVFQSSAGLSVLNQVKLPEPLPLDPLSSSTNLLGSGRSPLAASGEPMTGPVSPLTRDQLQQALIHLLKNDSSFLSAIHEAYITSLNQELSGKTMRP